MSISIRALAAADHDAWLPLWKAYQVFYKTDIPEQTTDTTWNRILDPSIPVHAFGAFHEGVMVGITHYLFHYSTWTTGPYCYLQDLYTSPELRGKGVGRKLIEAVYAAAGEKGASRVWWLTHETNETAMRLYEKVADRSGFVQYRKMLP